MARENHYESLFPKHCTKHVRPAVLHVNFVALFCFQNRRFLKYGMIDDPALARRIHDVDLTVSRLEGIGVRGCIARPIHNVAAIGVGFVLVGGNGRR